MRCHRVHISVFPLGSSEPVRVLTAIEQVWVKPAFKSIREHQGAWHVEAEMEAPLPPQDDEPAFVERISMAIWHRLGRYVKVVVDLSPDEADEIQHRELSRSEYLRLMRTP